MVELIGVLPVVDAEPASVNSILQLQYSNTNEFYVQDGFEFIAHAAYNSEKMDVKAYMQDLIQDAKDD